MNNSKEHAIPQNIMSVEFKLIGDMSLKQFAYIAVPLLIGFLMYVFHVNFAITISLTLFFLLIASFLAFVPIDGRNADTFLTNFVVSIKNPTQRVLRKNDDIPSILNMPKRSNNAPQYNKDAIDFLYQSPQDFTISNSDNTNLTSALDVKERASMQDINNVIAKMNSISNASNISPNLQSNNISPSSNVSMPNDFSNVGTPLNPQDNNNIQTQGNATPNLQSNNIPPSSNVSMPNDFSNVGTPLNPQDNNNGTTAPQNEEYNPFDINNLGESSAKKDIESAQNININIDLLNKKTPNPLEQNISSAVSSAHLNNPSLPNGGVSVQNNISDSNDTDTKIANNNPQSQNLGDNVNLSEVSQNKEEDSLLTLNENPVIDTSINNSPTSASDNNTQKSSADDYSQNQLNTILDKIKLLEDENRRLKEELKVEEVQNKGNVNGANSPVVNQQELINHLPDFINTPNVVSGVVLTADSRILTNAIVIIKDTSSKPIRAVKTNQLGQFYLRTPLTNGQYNVDVTYQGITFNPVGLTLDGNKVNPLIFVPVKN